MTYYAVNGLGDSTDDRIVEGIVSTRAAARSLLDELSSSAVARVFAQSAIDGTATLVQSANNALDSTVPSLLRKAAAGDVAAKGKAVDLLTKLNRALTEHKNGLQEFWAQTPSATKLLVTVLAGLKMLSDVIGLTDFIKNPPSLPKPLGNALYIVAGFIGLALLIKIV